MLKDFLTAKYNDLSKRIKNNDFRKLVEKLIVDGNMITEINLDDGIVLFSIGGNNSVLLCLDKEKGTLKLETTIVFDSAIVNLKTLSNMAHTSMSHGFGISGIITNENGTSKIYVGKDIEWADAVASLNRDLKTFQILIGKLSEYLNFRTKQKEITHLDFSMFDKIKLKNFNPQAAGEKKDFLYTSWQKYADHVVGERTDEDDFEEISEEIEEISACAEFELKNKMSLSEVGNFILDELHWSKSLSLDNREDIKFNVN